VRWGTGKGPRTEDEEQNQSLGLKIGFLRKENRANVGFMDPEEETAPLWGLCAPMTAPRKNVMVRTCCSVRTYQDWASFLQKDKVYTGCFPKSVNHERKGGLTQFYLLHSRV
jgi:hypothetical protein